MTQPEELQLTCKNCGRTFRSPTQMDRASFEGVHISNERYQCPICGHPGTYTKEDFFFSSDQP